MGVVCLILDIFAHPCLIKLGPLRTALGLFMIPAAIAIIAMFVNKCKQIVFTK